MIFQLVIGGLLLWAAFFLWNQKIGDKPSLFLKVCAIGAAAWSLYFLVPMLISFTIFTIAALVVCAILYFIVNFFFLN